MQRHALRVFVVSLLLASAARAEPWRPFEAARARVVPALEILVGWCDDKGLAVERIEALEAILAFDPDHADARRRLGYRRTRDGAWTRRDSWRPPTGTKPEFRSEYEARRDRIVAEFVRETLDELLERKLRDEARDRVLDGLAAVAPDHGELREIRGEVLLDGRWVLRETATARKRRREIGRQAQEILAAVPAAAPAKPDALEQGHGLGRIHVAETTRGGGPVEAAEIAETTRFAAAAATLFKRLFELPELNTAYTFYLFPEYGPAGEVLRASPGITEAALKAASRIGSWWIPGQGRVLVYNRNPDSRREITVRQGLSTFGRRAFGVSTKHGAFHEGIGLYLGHALTGRRATWFVKFTDYSPESLNLGNRIREQGADWFALAREFHAKNGPPDYGVLLSLDVNAMTPEDVVLGYAFAAYLLEGEPPGRNAFLAAVGGGQPVGEAAREHLGFTVGELSRRVVRWLHETASN